MSWLARLKTGKHPDTHATKPTKPTTDPQNRGFVGFVASLPECFQKTAVSTDAANDPTPEPRKPESERRMVTLAPDPGAPRLLAMAMAFCDRTAASDKARAQWAQDVEDTPPELRGDLYQHLRGQLPPPPPAASPTCQPAPAKPLPHFSMEQPWRAADRLYQNHHWQCPECMASARAAPGTADRCAEGQRLHDEYTSEGHRP
jgi:hypothetical protein